LDLIILGPDSVIAEAILIGNIEVAVELCMKHKKYTEAVILAMTGRIDNLFNYNLCILIIICLRWVQIRVPFLPMNSAIVLMSLIF